MQTTEDNKGRRPPRVVVVGAGFAGVGAVRRLVQGGLSDVILLEAGERPGGRVQTRTLEGGFVELGGQYLHGESELFHCAKRQGLLNEEEEGETLLDTIVVYRSHTFRTHDGTALNTQDVGHNLQLLEALLERQVKAGQEEGGSDVTVSAGQYLQRLYPEYRARMAGDHKVKAAMIKWLEAWSVLDCAATVHDLSLPGQTRYVYEEGSGVQQTRTGLWHILNLMLQEFMPQCRLLLSKPVKRVVWRDAGSVTSRINNVVWSDRNLTERHRGYSGDPDSDSVQGDAVEKQSGTDLPCADVTSDYNRVTVECEDGDVIRADHVIVTPSIGYLKEHPDFFVPRLPPKHREAIDTMGFGNVAKVFLLWDAEQEEQLQGTCWSDPMEEWRRRMLGSDVEGIALLWPDDVRVQIGSAQSPQRTSGGRQWYEEVCLMEFITSYGPCLVAWVGGEGAVIMESLPESEVKDVLYEVLVKFLGKPDLPPPSGVIRSEWHRNPYTRGAYSYLATGVPLERQVLLTHPVPSPQDPVLQLAGEACSTKYYSTAHGALYSGQEAADTLLRHHNLLQ
ncbi:hypothetical protein ACOMHN_006683 [Nucella lapillus]